MKVFSYLNLKERDPLGIRYSAAYVSERSNNVAINADKISLFCDRLEIKDFDGKLEWEPNYHYFDNSELTVAYVFVLDTINFCFWGEPKWKKYYRGKMLNGYWALAAALTEETSKNRIFLTSENLASIDVPTLEKVLDGKVRIPLLEERVMGLRELGKWVSERYNGSFIEILKQVDFDAIELVKLLVSEVKSFQDRAVYKGKGVCFYKRAQILAADLYGIFKGKRWGNLKKVDRLTAFADYKVPQILRHYGILKYSKNLADKVDNKIPLEVGSVEEIEIRANMIWAVEMIQLGLENRGFNIPSYQIDWLLWNTSQEIDTMKPYHRTRTIFY